MSCIIKLSFPSFSFVRQKMTIILSCAYACN